MGTIGAKNALAQTKSTSLSTQVCKGIIRSDDKVFRSLYRDERASADDIANAIMKLSTAYPLADKEESARFFALLTNRVAENGFTKKRLDDAVNWLIDNFRFKNINIADVITFDKRVRLYNYQEYCSAIYHNRNLSEDFTTYGKIDGITFWYRKSELAKLKGKAG